MPINFFNKNGESEMNKSSGACEAVQPSFFSELIWKIKRVFKKKEVSSLRRHALREFKAVGYLPIDQCEDGPNKWMQENVLELLEVFSKQGHSGFSASYCRDMFQKLAAYEPLVPLSGADDEWNDVGGISGYPILQNNRCSHVFKENGRAYDIDGVVFEEPDGCRFTGFHSRVTVQFPYTPKRVIAQVGHDASDDEKTAAAQKALAAA